MADEEEVFYVLLRIPTTASTWKLLQKYIVLCNQHLIDRGIEPLNYSRLIGSLCSVFALENKDAIERFDELHVEIHKRGLPRLFSADQLAAIAAIAGAEVPDFCGAGGAGPHVVDFPAVKERRTVLSADLRPPRPFGGPARQPRQVRARSGRPSTRSRVGTEESSESDSNGE